MKLAPLLLLLLVPATALARPEPDKAVTYSIAVDGYASDGPADAKVTLVMAQDYADPFSQRSRTTLEELRKKYGNDLRIVFRNMVVHPRNAMASALASCAALKQKSFDAMEDKLWGQFGQRQWDLSDVDLGNGPQKCWDTVEGCKNAVGFANELGLKVDRFKADMRACVQVVEDDMTDLKKFAVQATPTFFINGAAPLRRAADGELREARRRGAGEGERQAQEGHAEGPLLPDLDRRQGREEGRSDGAADTHAHPDALCRGAAGETRAGSRADVRDSRRRLSDPGSRRCRWSRS